MLATLQRQLQLGLALDALQSQHNLLGGLGLLVEDRLGLTTITGLLSVVSSLSLGEERGLAGLVLGHLVLGVLAALLALAVGVSGLGNVDLCDPSSQRPAKCASSHHASIRVENGHRPPARDSHGMGVRVNIRIALDGGRVHVDGVLRCSQRVGR